MPRASPRDTNVVDDHADEERRRGWRRERAQLIACGCRRPASLRPSAPTRELVRQGRRAGTSEAEASCTRDRPRSPRPVIERAEPGHGTDARRVEHLADTARPQLRDHAATLIPSSRGRAGGAAVRAELLQRADDRGVALAAAAAERRRTDAAAAAAQLVDEREHDARARHADRVAERDRAAVDVDDVVGDAEVASSTRCRPRRTPR